MKHSGNKQWQRKPQSSLASLMYRLAQGSVETEPFTSLLQQIYSDRITANPVNNDALKNSLAQIQLGKLPKTKRYRRKFAHFLKIQKQNVEDRKQPSDNPLLTIGQVVNGWAGLTGQDKTEFVSKVCPKIRMLAIEHYQAIGHLGCTDSQAYENPESAFNFMTDLFNILIEETPADKKDSLVEQIKTTLFTSGTYQQLLEHRNGFLLLKQEFGNCSVRPTIGNNITLT